MIEIYNISKEGIRTSIAMRVPEALVSAVSAHFRELCSSHTKRIFTTTELLGECPYKYESKLYVAGLDDVLLVFVEWLYTGRELSGNCYRHDLWHFGQKIRAPAFQNTILRGLRSELQRSHTHMGTTEYQHADQVNDCWKKADFSKDDENGCDLKNQNTVYWENKQFLKFMLDFLVYVGLESSIVTRVLRDGGDIAIQLSKLMLKAASGGPAKAPWDPQNFSKYLLDEKIY